MKHFGKVVVLVLCLALALSLVAYGAKQAEPSKIVIGRDFDSTILDPVTQSSNSSIWMFDLMMDGLVKISDDGTKIEGNLAKTWDISPDKLTYTFHLIEGVKFSDGTPVKGEDWVWSLLRARDEKASIWGTNLQVIKDVKAPDDKTVIITLKENSALIISALAMFNTTVGSKAYFEKVGPDGYTQKPIGTGPYMIDKWAKGEYLSFKKNPYYRIQGLPKTDEIRFTVVPDDNTRVMQLQSGAIDVATNVPYNKMQELSSDPKLFVKEYPGTMSQLIGINCKRKPLDDVRVRQALNYAIDRDALKKIVLCGYGEIGRSFMMNSLMYANTKLEGYPVNIEKAKKLLADAGYPNGFKVELLIRSGRVLFRQIAVFVQSELRKIGVDVTIKSMEQTTARVLQRGYNYDLALVHWSSDMIDPAQVVNRFVIYNDATRGYYTQWKNDEAIKLALDATKELDENKRREMYYKIQEIHTEGASLITLVYRGNPVAMDKNIKGFVQIPLGNYRFENLEKIAD